MQKLAKKLSVLMTVVMVLSLMFSFTMTAGAATVYPQVQYAQEPQMEYTVGDRVSFNLYTPNYGGRVQYRVVLWNDETKSYKDLWNTTDRYYDRWMPYGNEIFTLGWPISEPGHYRITIYAKRAGITNNECYLKGFNCDSYMESDSFVVKAKEVAKEEPKPDVATDSIKLVEKSAQQVFGKDYEVKANVGKAGVRVIFQIDAADDSMNKDEVKEAVSDSNGIAAVKYTRYYGDADIVTVYPAAVPTLRDAMKVYWGAKPILTVTSTTATVTNNGFVQYEAKLLDPRTGAPMANRTLFVMFKENINGQVSQATASSQFDLGGSRLYQISQNNFRSLMIQTDINGVARFTVQGANTSATPIVYYDNYGFYSFNQVDSTQVETRFSGDRDKMLDEMEMQFTAPTAAFSSQGFDIIVDGADVAHRSYKSALTSGRVYTITVNYAGTTNPYAGGMINLGLNELLDASASTTTFAKFIAVNGVAVTPTSGPITAQRLNSKGQINFEVASNVINDKVTPMVWIDKDTPNPLTGATNYQLESFDQVQICGATIFDDTVITTAALTGPTTPVPNNSAAKFTFKMYDQNDELFAHSKWARVKYTFVNTGSKDLVVTNPVGFLAGTFNINSWQYAGYVDRTFPAEGVIVKVGQTATIVGTTEYNGTTVSFDVRNYDYISNSDDALGGKVKVSAYANMLKNPDPAYYTDVNMFLDGGSKEATFAKAAFALTEVPYDPTKVYYGFVMNNLDTDGDGANDAVNKLDGTTNFGTIKVKLPTTNNYVVIPYASLNDNYMMGSKQVLGTDIASIDFDKATTIQQDINGTLNVVDKFEKGLSVNDAIYVYSVGGYEQRVTTFKLIDQDDSYMNGKCYGYNGRPLPLPIVSEVSVVTPSVKAVAAVNAFGMADFGGLTGVVNAVTNSNATLNDYTVIFRHNATDANAPLAKAVDANNKTILVTWGVNVPPTTWTAINALFTTVTFSASTNFVWPNDLERTTLTLHGGVNPIAEQKGVYSFTLNTALTFNQKITVNGIVYTAGVDFAIDGGAAGQAANLAAAIDAKDARWGTVTANASGVITLTEAIGTGNTLANPTVQ